MKRHPWLIEFAVASLLWATPGWSAELRSFTNHTAWVAAVGGASDLTVLHFDGPTETHGKYVNDPSLVSAYAELGVIFLPFRGTSVYPQIHRGQGFQISDPARDGLVVNVPSPNPVWDLEGRAIRFDFTGPVRAIGLWFNGPIWGGDGGYLQLYDAQTNLIGDSATSAAGGFVGVISPRLIRRVHVVNTFDYDATFGIWDLQFLALPQLTVARTANNIVVVSWPLATAEAWLLEATSSALPDALPAWTPIPPPFLTLGGNRLFIEPATLNNKFYRLRKP